MRNVDAKRYQDAQDKKNREEVNVGAIVKVVSFNPENMTVTVQPISKHLENGEYKSQPQILDVPIGYTKSGGFIIRPWFKPGDIGHVTYIDHDIDKAVASGAECEPNTERNHSTTDAVFSGSVVPGTTPVKNLPEEADVIATDDAVIYIAVLRDEIQALAKNRDLDVKTYFLTVNGMTGALEFTVRNMELDKETIKLTIDADSGKVNLTTRNAEKDKETLAAEINGTEGDVTLTTRNYDTDKETTKTEIKGQDGKINIITKNKTTGNETAYIKMDGTAKTIEIQGYVTVKGSFDVTSMTIPD